MSNPNCEEVKYHKINEEVCLMAIKWTYETGRSYDSLPSGAYRVQIESAVETVSQSGNQMIKMELGVLGYRNKVKHHLTFSPKNRRMVNKALGEIYSSFDIPEGNLDAKTWVGKVGVAQLEPGEYNGGRYTRVAYFLTKRQQKELGFSLEDTREAVIIEEEDDEDYYSSLRPNRMSSFGCLHN